MKTLVVSIGIIDIFNIFKHRVKSAK